MAGIYTKKMFDGPAEELTLLKDSNIPRIISKGPEPVKLSPGWEGTGKSEDELNFKGITMDQADLELNPPKDKWNLVYIILLLHGIGTLMPWNMFITADDYFIEYKLNTNYTTDGNPNLAAYFITTMTFTSQLPNVLFNWLNIFVPLGGDLTSRIVWGIFTQVLVFVFTIILAMIDTFSWTKIFYGLTLLTVIISNIANGIYQNSVYGIAAKLPGKYTGAVILGSNISGTLTAIIALLSKLKTPNIRTAAIYYFITALFILLACFDTYFALPLNRYYRYQEMVNQREQEKKLREAKSKNSQRTPYGMILKQCAPQLFNVFFIFFVTLSLFPAVQSNIKPSNFNLEFDGKSLFTNIMCFIVFNITAMLGSSAASFIQWPNKKWLVIPVVLRALLVPLFLLCNYQPAFPRTLNVMINNDWCYLVLGITMGFTSGYFSSLAMVYCPTMVEPRYASVAGMFGAAFLITGIFSGIVASFIMPTLVSLSIWKTDLQQLNHFNMSTTVPPF